MHINYSNFLSVCIMLSCIACNMQQAQDQMNLSVDEYMPQPLREDIQVEKFLEVERGGIRLAREPISGELYYNTMKGDIFRISENTDGSFSQKKVYTVEDHGIAYLQGMRFYDSLLFLAGNIRVNDEKALKGKVVRGHLNAAGSYEFTLLAITEAYAKPKTLYSHEFNGIAISPDGEYVYVNSGARTDHGEVQDNDGLYPNLREVPLTACIFRLPAQGENILLKNDSSYLAENGYLFSDGIRNNYDLAFAPNGHLFGVSNSSDYDHAEEMNWLREGHHYGYPWEMGNTQNPQQYADWIPDPEHDPFINRAAYAYNHHYFAVDPDFPKKPKGLMITPPIQNEGPDANFYRDRETGEVKDGDETGVTVGTFTPHRSPLGLIFDKDSILSDPFRGDGFVLSYSSNTQPLMRPFPDPGGDMLHLKLSYDPETDNYKVNCYRIVENLSGPTDALMIDNVVYIMENRGMIWKVTLPSSALSL